MSADKVATRAAPEVFDITNDATAKLQIVLSLYSAMISIAQEIRSAVERIAVLGGSGMLLLCTWLVTRDQGRSRPRAKSSSRSE